MNFICAASIWPVLGLKLAADEPLVCTLMLEAGLASGVHLQLAQQLPNHQGLAEHGMARL